MIVYKITNTVNGKIYIGQTTRNCAYRWSTHVAASKYSKLPIHCAIAKYGKDAFVIEVIAIASNKAELNELERKFITEHNCFAPLGYNIGKGGEGNAGFKFSEESKQRMSAMRKQNVTEAMRDALRLGAVASATEENKQARSERMRKSNPQTGKQGFFTGRKHSPETREKMRQARLRRLSA